MGSAQRYGSVGNDGTSIPLVYAAFLVTGTMVGVGLLAIPVLLSPAGFRPGLATMAGIALLVWTSGYALAERVMDYHDEHMDLAALYQADLGSWVRWMITPIYLLLFYALLIAYLTGAAHTLAGLIPLPALSVPIWLLLAFLFASLAFLFGQPLLLRWNGALVMAMMVAFVVLLAVSARHMEATRLEPQHWRVLPLTLPMLCCAFAYHNVIPLVCREQRWDRRRVHVALSLGLALAFLLTASWFAVVVGSLPLTDNTGGPSLTAAFRQGCPATVPLARLLKSPAITLSGLVFSLLAILTSYIGVGASLCSFLRDAAPFFRPPRRSGGLLAIVFLPPLVLALANPGIFFDMVDLIGGLGMIALFGILPLLAFLCRRAAGRPLLRTSIVLLLALFLGILSLELGKVSGFVRLDPDRGIVLAKGKERIKHTMTWLLDPEQTFRRHSTHEEHP